MYQAIEATYHQGTIHPCEPVHFEENEQVIVLRLTKNSQTQQSDIKKIRGAMKGILSPVDQFIENKALEIKLENNL